MSDEEVIDAESSTLNKNSTALDHLKHLISVGWGPRTPLILKFVSKYNLQKDLEELVKNGSY